VAFSQRGICANCLISGAFQAPGKRLPRVRSQPRYRHPQAGQTRQALRQHCAHLSTRYLYTYVKLTDNIAPICLPGTQRSSWQKIFAPICLPGTYMSSWQTTLLTCVFQVLVCQADRQHCAHLFPRFTRCQTTLLPFVSQINICQADRQLWPIMLPGAYMSSS
jgi:hypothetical protein